jgi:SAM-dependent methyltransferase
MRDIYVGNRISDLTDEETNHIADKALNLGLVVPNNSNNSNQPGFSLTAPGYLVGNIAKEYCNWLDNDRAMPPPRPSNELIADKDILDLGCSIGRWLWEFQPHAKSVTGLELRREYIEIGKALAEREKITPPPILHGCIEELDHIFSSESADFIFCTWPSTMFQFVKPFETWSLCFEITAFFGLEWNPFSAAWTKCATIKASKAEYSAASGSSIHSSVNSQVAR